MAVTRQEDLRGDCRGAAIRIVHDSSAAKIRCNLLDTPTCSAICRSTPRAWVRRRGVPRDPNVITSTLARRKLRGQWPVGGAGKITCRLVANHLLRSYSQGLEVVRNGPTGDSPELRRFDENLHPF